MNRDIPAKKTPAPKWVLVIAGQPTLRDIMERFLQAAGYFVSTAADGLEGLDKARSLPIDLIVLDLDLKESGGFAVSAKFKSEAITADIPVLLLPRFRGLPCGERMS